MFLPGGVHSSEGGTKVTVSGSEMEVNFAIQKYSEFGFGNLWLSRKEPI